MSKLGELLLQAPDGQLDACMFPLIRKWSEPPEAIQILEVLDQCVHGSLASGLMVSALEGFLYIAIKREETTYETLVKKAVWRNA